MAPIKETLFGGGGSVIGALKPPIFEVVIMNTSFVQNIFLLKQTSFFNTTFQLNLLMSLKNNIHVT